MGGKEGRFGLGMLSRRRNLGLPPGRENLPGEMDLEIGETIQGEKKKREITVIVDVEFKDINMIISSLF